ncbi:MAG: hypothetical protein ACSW70_03560 [Eubacteriales bacterium]
MAKRNANAKQKHGFLTLGGLDIPFFMIVIALITLGLIMMFSASSSYSNGSWCSPSSASSSWRSCPASTTTS